MEHAKRRKVTQEEIDKAINPDLTDAVTTLCGITFKVKVLPLNKEQVFLKMLKSLLPQSVSGEALIEALLSADIGTLCEMAAIIANNSGQELSAGEILEAGRLVDIVTAIQTQLDENGYLDFLLRMAAVMPGILSARQ